LMYYLARADQLLILYDEARDELERGAEAGRKKFQALDDFTAIVLKDFQARKGKLPRDIQNGLGMALAVTAERVQMGLANAELRAGNPDRAIALTAPYVARVPRQLATRALAAGVQDWVLDVASNLLDTSPDPSSVQPPDYAYLAEILGVSLRAHVQKSS